MPGWTPFDDESRERFRSAMHADDDTWGQATGCALSVAAIALAHYRASNEALAGASRRALEAVLPGC